MGVVLVGGGGDDAGPGRGRGRLGSVAVQRSEGELPERSIYRLLHAERDRLFPNELFTELHVQHGPARSRRRS
jgi:hypothetical protein